LCGSAIGAAGDSMEYTQQNKKAWEEAFENRRAGWGSDIVERIRSKNFAFFNNDMAGVLDRYSFAGKNIGQFCCNNGRELLSLAHSGKAGACTGFDIAENQVAFARERAAELGLDCRFVATDILDIGDEYREAFDFALITIGALCWFRDLDRFFGVVGRCMKEGAMLFINEQHPVCGMLSLPGEDNYNAEHPTELVNSYFEKEWRDNSGASYLTGKERISEMFISYSHPFGEIFSALLKNGLAIREFREFDYDISDSFGQLDHKGIPLSYILVAEKDR
jgi:SAM-dependent methyltransferase